MSQHKPFKEEVDELTSKIKCIEPECDGNGNIPHAVDDGNGGVDWEAQQCQYHAEVIFPLKKSLDLYKQKILEAYTTGFSDLVHPEFCKQSGEQFKECAKCRADKVKQIIENI